jgi:membrane protease YdiL (CAAX protease family)
MPGVLDLLFIVLLTVVLPLYAHFIDWPRLQGWLREIPDQARRRAYLGTMAQQWVLVGVVAVFWRRFGRSGAALRLVPPTGWRLGLALGVVALLVLQQIQTVRAVSRSAKSRARVRSQVGVFADIVPHTRAEAVLSMPLALTAGICEEVLFRGYLLWALAPLLTAWGAAVVAVVVFGLLHSYQGRKGGVRTGLVGLVMTILVAVTRSLYPAMVVHALIDVGGLLACYIALRERDEEGEAVAAEPRPSTALTEREAPSPAG